MREQIKIISGLIHMQYLQLLTRRTFHLDTVKISDIFSKLHSKCETFFHFKYSHALIKYVYINSPVACSTREFLLEIIFLNWSASVMATPFPMVPPSLELERSFKMCLMSHFNIKPIL